MNVSYNDMKIRLKLFVYTKMLPFKIDPLFHKLPTTKNKTFYTDPSHDIVLFFLLDRLRYLYGTAVCTSSKMRPHV
jgi:hypothetical protein